MGLCARLTLLIVLVGTGALVPVGPVRAAAAIAPPAAAQAPSPSWSGLASGRGSGPTSGTGTDTVSAPARRTSGRTFYVDPASGADDGPGTVTRPWRTLSRVSTARLVAGDTVRLRRGARHVGALEISASGTAARRIVVRAYDHGSKPVVSEGKCVTVFGAYVTIRNLKVADCGGTGFRYGIDLHGSYDVVRGVNLTGNMVGVAIDRAAHHVTVRDSYIHRNTQLERPSGCYDDYGAQGISVSGDHARIVRNRIDGHRADSPDYGIDGAAVDIIGAEGTKVLRNRGRNNATFVELGNNGPRVARDTLIAYNQITSSWNAVLRTKCAGTAPEPIREFALIVYGTASAYGGTVNTKFIHNSVRMTGKGSTAILCLDTCATTTLRVVRNVLVAEIPGNVDTSVSGFVHRNNIVGPDASTAVWGPTRNNAYHERFVRPRFRDPRQDLRLRRRSPGVDALAKRWGELDRDVRGVWVPRNDRAEIGAWERRS